MMHNNRKGGSIKERQASLAERLRIPKSRTSEEKEESMKNE